MTHARLLNVRSMSMGLMGSLLLSAYACGGDSGGDSDDGSGGTSGSGASGGTGGDDSGGSSGEAGSGGTGGGTDGGTGGTAGTGGSSTTGTSGGSGGTTPSIACTEDGDCEDAGMVCDPLAELCTECLFDSDCGDGERCDTRTCVEAVACESAADCEGVDGAEACNTITGHCAECVSASDCAGTADCINNQCRLYVGCSNSLDCPTPQVCNPSTARCAQCVTSNDCADNFQCVESICRRTCSSDNDCTALGQLCDFSYQVCARCVTNSDCPEAYNCSSGRCQLDACEQGSGYCQSTTTLYACNAAGSGYDYRSCYSNQTCIEGEQTSCQDQVCTPGATECNAEATAVITCAADGLSFEVATDCSTTDEVCYQNTCQALECAPYSYFCEDNVLRYCDYTGLSSSVQLTCTETQRCDAATIACVDRLCAPDEPVCDSSVATTCDATGDGYQSGGTDCADTDEFCVNGECQQCDGTILLLGDDDITGNGLMQAALESAGMDVTLINSGVISYDGTQDAAEFGAVVASIGGLYGTAMPQAGQDSIVAAHAAGTGYLTNEYASYQQFASVPINPSLGPLTLLTYVTNSSLTPLITLTSTEHPIWDGLATSFTPTISGSFTFGQLVNGGVSIATCAGCDGGGAYSGAAVVVREGAGGRVVHLAHAGNVYDAYTDANLLKMFVNAAQWAAGCK